MWYVSRSLRVRTAVLLVLTSIVSLFFTVSTVAQEQVRYFPGQVRFKMDHSQIYLPGGVNQLIFDTSDCLEYRQNLPSYRLFGDLKLDSIDIDGVVREVSDSAQIQGIVINSQPLLEILYENKAVKLKRTFPNSIPYDTLYWSPTRKKWLIEPDMSKHYRVLFNSLTDVDSMVVLLSTVPNIQNVSAIEIPTAD